MLPAHLADRFVFVLFHPANQVRQNGSQVVNPMLQQRGSHHRHMRSRHHGFEDVFGAVYTARNRQVGVDPPIEDGDPVQPQQQFLRTAQRQAGHHFERFNIEIRLVKAVEENQPVRPGRVQLFAHVSHRGEKVRQLHRHRNTARSL